MKLINTKTGFVVVEFHNGIPKFYDRFLEAEMKEEGISIPPFKRSEFGEKKTVLLNDPLFEKAFTEVYHPIVIADPAYQWEK